MVGAFACMTSSARTVEEYFCYPREYSFMTQHTGRDAVWDAAIRTATTEESFSVDDIVENESITVSKRTVRDTMGTMADLGWLKKQEVNSSQWQPGVLITDDESLTTLEEHDNENLIDNFENVSELEKGEEYVGVVDKASPNALIWLNGTGGNHINLGPINGSAVGEEVRFRYLGGVWGKCLENEYTYDGYDPKNDGSSSSNRSSSNRSSKRRSKDIKTREGTITDKNPNNKNKLLRGHI